MRPLLLPALFALAVAGAWAWFHVAPPEVTDRIRFEVRSEVPGWRFEAQPIGETARAILATTNLFNGTFHGPNRERVTVFAAEWRATAGAAMSVVQHTPDICWVGAGWVPRNVGQPDRIEFPVGQRPLPFECRVFSAPDGGRPELVLWCTLVGGAVLPEAGKWAIETDLAAGSRTRFDWAGRRVGLTHLVRNVAARRQASGEKQFVRLSVPLVDGWQQDLDWLARFLGEWLKVVETTQRGPQHSV